MRRIPIAMFLGLGCGPAGGGGTTEGTSEGSTGTSDATTTSDSITTADGSSTDSTTGGCGELPLCDLCPDESTQLCGAPCPTPGQTCSNPIGDGMQCLDGAWECIVHPPLGVGCNEMCALADGCTEIGCTSGLTLSLVADTFAPGVYGIALAANPDPDDCTLTISDDPMDCAIPPCVSESTCNALYLLGETPMRIELALGILAQLDVTVTRDDLEIASETFAPAYEVVAPNGPGCGPACAVALAELAIP